jgi:parallel beta-helix repeat protein
MKRVVTFTIVLMLFSVTLFVGSTRSVVAQGTTYIRSDGSVDPETAPIQRVGDTYTFTGNIFAPIGVLDRSGIVVERDNIVLDGAGYSLRGVGDGAGVNVTSRSNATIKNLEIKKFAVGVVIWESSNNTIFGSTMTQNDVGIGLWQSSNIEISGNIIFANNGTGIAISGSSALNSAVGNYVANNRIGIGFGFGTSNVIAGNYIANNEEGIFFGGNPPVSGASDNTLYRNSLINNTKQVDDYHWTNSFSRPSINTWNESKEGNYWSDYKDRYPNATELNSSGIWATPYVLDPDNKDNYPLMSNPLPPPSDTKPPAVSVISPENKSYAMSNISLILTVNEAIFRMAYSLDRQSNVAITENATLTELPEGLHSIIVYASDSFGNTGASSTVNFTVDITPPSISILSPENKTYDATDISLTFALNEPAPWMAYSLKGQTNETIAGNVTLAALPEGSQSVVVYANDTAGNVGASETIYFSIQPFPMILVVAVIVIIVIVGATLIVYFTKAKRTKGKAT